MNLRHSSIRKYRDDKRTKSLDRSGSLNLLLAIALLWVGAATVSGQTLGVDELIRTALEKNKGLQADQAQLKAAEGRLKQAGLKANPMLEASATSGVNDRGMQAGSVMLSVPLEANGRRQRRLEVAERELERLKHEVKDKERMIAGDVRAKYADLIEAVRTSEIYKRLLENNRHSLQILKVRVEQGASAALELGQLDAEILKIDAQKAANEARIQVLIEQLREAIGIEVAGTASGSPERISLSDLKDEFEITTPFPGKQEAISMAIRQREDLAAALAGEALADSIIAQAKTEGRYDLSVFTELGFQRLAFDPLGTSRESSALEPIGMRTAMVRGGVSITLPTRNKNQGNIEAAQALREEARLRRQFVETMIRRQVAAAWERANGAHAVLATINGRLMEAAESNLNIVRRSFELGYVRMAEVLAEQRRSLEVQMSRVAALKESFAARMELDTQAGIAVRK